MQPNIYKEKLESALSAVGSVGNLTELQELRIALLGKAGEFTSLLKGLKDVPIEERSQVGAAINEARVSLESAFKAKQAHFEALQLEQKLQNEKIDITINKNLRCVGTLHPISQTRNKIADFFVSMGFLVASGPEIETEYYNFEALNIPSDHPARDMQDTFFIECNSAQKMLLRSHTSGAQIRMMEKSSPPIKMISPGRVYRSDDVDATHSPMFHQMEGLVVDKGITLCDLKGTLELFAKHFFGKDTKTRFRPSYFPFTEPSVEVDASCYICGGDSSVVQGCRVCKGTGYIEILGAGMVHRNVLKNCYINPDIYTGFAFGMGLDRITTLLHGIDDLRVAFENDIRFLNQFKGGVI